MSRTRVKICGVTHPDDALAAAIAGADAIGLVLYPKAKRYITPDRAREIISVLPPFVTPVALFLDEPPQVVLDTAAELNIRCVQLHGDESPDEVADLPGLTVIKAIRVNRETISKELSKWRAMVSKGNLKNLAGFVLETSHPTQPGGTGVANDWEWVKTLQSRGEFEGLPRLITAGGLRPESVAQVVRDIKPWAVDVSSGVEGGDGRKSHEKLAAFIQGVHRASDQGNCT
jgi:phosphoribosylanthranilate isomerase